MSSTGSQVPSPNEPDCEPGMVVPSSAVSASLQAHHAVLPVQSVQSFPLKAPFVWSQTHSPPPMYELSQATITVPRPASAPVAAKSELGTLVLAQSTSGA